MQQDDFLRYVWCCYVLRLCGRHGHALLKFWPPWYGTISIGENIAWCRLPIVRIFGIVGVRVAFNFGRIVRPETQLCILGSSQIPKNVFDGHPTLLSRFDMYELATPTTCARSGRVPPLRTWYFLRPMCRVSFHFASSPLLCMESLCPILRLSFKAELVLASRSPCWSASTPFVCSRTRTVGECLFSVLAFRSLLDYSLQ